MTKTPVMIQPQDKLQPWQVSCPEYQAPSDTDCGSRTAAGWWGAFRYILGSLCVSQTCCFMLPSYQHRNGDNHVNGCNAGRECVTAAARPYP